MLATVCLGSKCSYRENAAWWINNQWAIPHAFLYMCCWPYKAFINAGISFVSKNVTWGNGRKYEKYFERVGNVWYKKLGKNLHSRRSLILARAMFFAAEILCSKFCWSQHKPIPTLSYVACQEKRTLEDIGGRSTPRGCPSMLQEGYQASHAPYSAMCLTTTLTFSQADCNRRQILGKMFAEGKIADCHKFSGSLRSE